VGLSGGAAAVLFDDDQAVLARRGRAHQPIGESALLDQRHPLGPGVAIGLKAWRKARPQIFSQVQQGREARLATAQTCQRRLPERQQAQRCEPEPGGLSERDAHAASLSARKQARQSAWSRSIPYGAGLVKNSYVGRTFIQPSQTIRQLGIRLKLNPLREIIEGKRIVVVDDSIVRGNTQRAIVRMLREAGAREIHVRISSPPVKWPCFYGIDFATRAELIASGLDVEEIRRSIGADSLGYVSLEGLIEATEIAENKLCSACFTGKYPIAIPADLSEGKSRLEITEVHGHK
jgi:hypothetical protein